MSPTRISLCCSKYVFSPGGPLTESDIVQSRAHVVDVEREEAHATHAEKAWSGFAHASHPTLQGLRPPRNEHEAQGATSGLPLLTSELPHELDCVPCDTLSY